MCILISVFLPYFHLNSFHLANETQRERPYYSIYCLFQLVANKTPGLVRVLMNEFQTLYISISFFLALFDVPINQLLMFQPVRNSLNEAKGNKNFVCFYYTRLDKMFGEIWFEHMSQLILAIPYILCNHVEMKASHVLCAVNLKKTSRHLMKHTRAYSITKKKRRNETINANKTFSHTECE